MANNKKDPNELSYPIPTPKAPPAIENPTTDGTTNPTPESQVQDNLPFRVYRQILFKRKQIALLPPDAGHWWVEIYREPLKHKRQDLLESYGWYPFIDKDGDGKQDYIVGKDGRRTPVRPGLGGTVDGVPGKLNRGFKYDPHANKKRGIEWDVDDLFYVILMDTRDLDTIKKCIRGFAKRHNAKWAYPGFPGADNCQTFQKAMIEHCNIHLRRVPVSTYRALFERPLIEDDTDEMGDKTQEE